MQNSMKVKKYFSLDLIELEDDVIPSEEFRGTLFGADSYFFDQVVGLRCHISIQAPTPP